jgi:uncharacterized protein YneF (UPF0154 family)
MMEFLFGILGIYIAIIAGVYLGVFTYKMLGGK